jgi:hypothetical protein
VAIHLLIRDFSIMILFTIAKSICIIIMALNWVMPGARMR